MILSGRSAVMWLWMTNRSTAMMLFHRRCSIRANTVPALALNTNTSTLTAIGNDYSYDVVFSRQVDGFAQEGDVVIGISTSGNSKNVYLALALAKRKGCFTAAFLGKDGGTIKDICDLPLVVKSNNTPHIQKDAIKECIESGKPYKIEHSPDIIY